MSETAPVEIAASNNASTVPTKPSSSAPAARPRVGIVRYDEYFDQRTFTTTLRKTSKPVSRNKINSKKPVIVVRRIIDSRGQHETTKVDIKSDALCDLILHINRDVESLNFTKGEPEADMDLLFHSYPGILKRFDEEQKKDSPDPSLVFDLTQLLRFISDDLGNLMMSFSENTNLGQVTFQLLYALFPPNTYVYRSHPYVEQDQILICRNISYDRTQTGMVAVLSCDFITNNGRSFGLAREVLQIPSFNGTSKIRDLSVYPLDFHIDKEDVYNHAVERGKKFAKIKRQLYDGTGFAFKEKRSMFGDEQLLKVNTFGRVMVDPAAFRLFQPNSPINRGVHRTLEDLNNLKDEEYLICTPVVLGFCFGTKMWGGFALENLHEIVWSDEAFERLVISKEQKTLIHALFRQHSTQTTQFDDLIVGKGKGLIGLLCGNPGCGKTLTAEAAAETTRRPLYVVSAGELGTNPEEVDERLARILELSHLWNAVLLIDEAEVFLQKRSTTDVARNALVSIFLRQLEYYQGILILTTNMVAQCDPAFESRIHFCIKYPDLDLESRKAIWRTFIEKASKNSGDIGEGDVNRLAQYKLNGRQIKNAVSISQCIALDQKSPLLAKHIDTVLSTLNDWETAKDRALCDM